MAAIRTDGLTKRFGSGEGAVVAVDDLDLVVEEGEVFGFLGPNGAGKSTTINALLDYVRPTAGSATVLGMDAQADSEAIRARMGVLPEGLGLYDRLTGRRHVRFAIEWQGADDDPDDVLDRVALGPDDARRPVGDYSKGMAQRLALGMALVGEPELLILDEPSTGLDPNGIRRMREIIREEAGRGTAVFFSSHILGQVEAVCDRVGILDDGRLVAVDTIDGLREAAGVGSQLLLRVRDPPDVDVGDVRGVGAVESGDDLVRVDCHDPRAKADVVARLVDEGVEILDVDSERASLEDVFAAYTDDDAVAGADDEDAADGASAANTNDAAPVEGDT